MADMVAGSELDALVAEKVMGWTVSRDELNGYDVLPDEYAIGFPPGTEVNPNVTIPYEIEPYSHHIAAAWMVAQKACGLVQGSLMRKIELHTFAAEPDGRTTCMFIDFDIGNGGGSVCEWSATGTTPAHAICLAALKVLATEV